MYIMIFVHYYKNKIIFRNKSFLCSQQMKSIVAKWSYFLINFTMTKIAWHTIQCRTSLGIPRLIKCLNITLVSFLTDRPYTLTRGPEVDTSSYGTGVSASQPITTKRHQLISTQQPVTSSHQYQHPVYSGPEHAAAAADEAGASNSCMPQSSAEHNMAATRQDTSVPALHSSSLQPVPTTSNGVATFEELTSNNMDVEDSEPALSKTIVLTGHGGLDKLHVQEKARRSPSNGEVLVKVRDHRFYCTIMLKLATE